MLILYPSKKNRWHLPGGHLQEGESYTDGVKREVFEETGIRIVSYEIVYKKHLFTLFIAKAAHNNVKLSKEHSNYKWIKIEDDLSKLNLTKETLKDIRITHELGKSGRFKQYASFNSLKCTKAKAKQVDISDTTT